MTAAHCVFKYGHGVQQIFGLTFFFSYGVNAENTAIRDIKSVYVPQETIDFLNEYKTWGVLEVETAHDVAVIELGKAIPTQIEIGKMSSKPVKKGTPFLFGGYGCEDPKFVTGGTDISAPISLKFASGKVTSFTPLVAEGLTYDGPVIQSSCQGDSGGPVYYRDPNKKMGLTEYIGTNSYHRLKSQGDPVNSQNNFSVVTTDSKLGIWVNDVLEGRIKAYWSANSP